MRDYKFRGKRKDNGEWVVGNYVSTDPAEAFILIGVTGHIKRDDYECYMVEVIPETVGQLTPLAERDGTDIYEGDTVKFHYFFQSLGENLGVQESEHELIGNIVWGEFGWSIDAVKGQHWEGYTGYQTGEGECSILELYSMNQSSIHEESFEVVGNIHDVNPAVQDSVIINMNIDPKEQAEQEGAGAAADAEAQNAQESATQDTAMEVKDSEEVTEG